VIADAPTKWSWISTDCQTLDAQVSALKAAGAVRVFRETASGNTDRRELAHALKSLGEGDMSRPRGHKDDMEDPGRTAIATSKTNTFGRPNHRHGKPGGNRRQ
jgi:hypothetical protein